VTVPKSLPASSMKELIALAKRRPGELNFASSGIANVQHLMGEQLAAVTGTKMVHVPYKGGGPALLDLVAGQVHFMFCSPSAMQYIRQGGCARSRSAASSAGSPARSPDDDRIRSAGFTAGEWWGIYAPAGRPPLS
jgi:tripartite-type tricarboxylate transporter receptor subunit TctC